MSRALLLESDNAQNDMGLSFEHVLMVIVGKPCEYQEHLLLVFDFLVINTKI